MLSAFSSGLFQSLLIRDTHFLFWQPEISLIVMYSDSGVPQTLEITVCNGAGTLRSQAYSGNFQVPAKIPAVCSALMACRCASLFFNVTFSSGCFWRWWLSRKLRAVVLRNGNSELMVRSRQCVIQQPSASFTAVCKYTPLAWMSTGEV